MASGTAHFPEQRVRCKLDYIGNTLVDEAMRPLSPETKCCCFVVAAQRFAASTARAMVGSGEKRGAAAAYRDTKKRQMRGRPEKRVHEEANARMRNDGAKK